MIFKEGEKILYKDVKSFLESQGWSADYESFVSGDLEAVEFCKENIDHSVEVSFKDSVYEMPEAEGLSEGDEIPQELFLNLTVGNINILKSPFNYFTEGSIITDSRSVSCSLCGDELHLLPNVLNYIGDPVAHAETLISNHLKNLNTFKDFLKILEDCGWNLYKTHIFSELDNYYSQYRFSLECKHSKNYYPRAFLFTNIVTMDPCLSFDGLFLNLKNICLGEFENEVTKIKNEYLI